MNEMLISLAKDALRRGKLAVAASYLRGLEATVEVRTMRARIASLRGEKADYDAMSRVEREAFDNR